MSTYAILAVMISVVDAQRDILLLPGGTNIWSGVVTQSFNSQAITWSLAKEHYTASGPYVWIPLALLFGMIPTIIQWFIYKVSDSVISQEKKFMVSQRWPKIGGFKVDTVILPLIYQVGHLMLCMTRCGLTYKL